MCIYIYSIINIYNGASLRWPAGRSAVICLHRKWVVHIKHPH